MISKTSNQNQNRCLIAIPAYNEEATIEIVVGRVRRALPNFDLLIVNDGSKDRTAQILDRLGVTTATHLSNLGYGRAIQTAIKYAHEFEYDVLITLDADGQHQPEQVEALYRESVAADWDLLIGSRFIEGGTYKNTPFGRRIGMQVFSIVVKLLTNRRIYDTTSGLKVVKKQVFHPFLHFNFVDFHAEAIIYLLRLGYRVGEYPISVAERTHGQSMHSALSGFKYPLMTTLMIILGIAEAELTRRRNKL